MRRELAATLAFLEQLALRPGELDGSHVDEAMQAGVSREALRDAAEVCALFSMIVRLADSLGWDVPEPARFAERAPAMLAGGYALGVLGGR